VQGFTGWLKKQATANRKFCRSVIPADGWRLYAARMFEQRIPHARQARRRPIDNNPLTKTLPNGRRVDPSLLEASAA
jgi:hypothetical protein